MLLAAAFAACGAGTRQPVAGQVQPDYKTFAAMMADSVSASPRRVRDEAAARAQSEPDSLLRHHYFMLVAKTCLATSQFDSARLVLGQVERFVERMPASQRPADLQAECSNMWGNIYSRTGDMDSARLCYRRAYDLCRRRADRAPLPDILINLADANNRLGRLDVGAAWYRHALLLCDSLGLDATRRTPIYYGLAQIYVAMRDFEQCDHYYNLAARGYERMVPSEKQFYLNNRGTSYYYRDDYATAITYFRRLVDLAVQYPDMVFELNLAWLNLGDCYLQQGRADSAEICIRRCNDFFRRIKMEPALYYIDTQRIELALLRGDLATASRLIRQSVTPAGIDPDMVHIRNRYLQQYCEEAGDYRRAYAFLKENIRLDDSVRSERVRMRTADLTLRYQQDSTLMAQHVIIQRNENRVLELQQTQLIWIAVTVGVLLVALFGVLYGRKKHALLMARNRRMISSLRLENIRNRLSPHFIFNVLNHEMAQRTSGEQQELARLVKLMRRNLELAEQLCVSLAEELDFVKTYIELERPSLGDDFGAEVTLAPEVCPERVQVPSMLIQIPVENAVKHALRGKEGARRLWISVSCEAGDAVRVSVTDNGGGYRPSGSRGTGTGMKVVMQTIQILNSKNREKIDVSVHNVPSPTGETGCEVSFLLPKRYRYEI